MLISRWARGAKNDHVRVKWERMGSNIVWIDELSE